MPSFTYPELALDGLLRRAAIRDPRKAALVTGSGTVDYAELDDRTDRVAACLEQAVGHRGASVGVANVLDPVFAACYYGTVRSGNIAVLVNPLIRPTALRHVFASAAVEVAFVPMATAELLVKLSDVLPKLRTVFVTDAEDEVVPADTVPLHIALKSVPEHPTARRAAAPGAVACVQFTTGTTGRPKGVRLTHRNLVANAAQTASAHALDTQAVTLNHLPLFHVMHLNSGVYAGATQILCGDPDPVASLALAARTGATHYYGLPARLHALAADPRLDGRTEGVPAGPRLTAVLSGGSALAPSTARRLRDVLGVPVVQGYGLAELSPLSHSQRPGDGARRGCVGPAVPGTECRIVDLATREEVPEYATGEIQIRGPQLMAGYLDEHEPSPVDGQGWFSTGDVGYLDEDGALFVVDRLGDVFKYDNELVSPTAVERVLTEDERVADCIAAGWPDPVHGAVVWAGIVLHLDAGQRWCSVLDVLDSVVERANAQLAPFEQIRRVQALDTVPRTPVGKPRRLELKTQLRAEAAAERAV